MSVDSECDFDFFIALIDNAEQARLSKRLVTLDQHVALDVPVGDLAVHEPDYRKLIAFLKAMEFSALTRRVTGAAALCTRNGVTVDCCSN